jgi:hypothetical protein
VSMRGYLRHSTATGSKSAGFSFQSASARMSATLQLQKFLPTYAAAGNEVCRSRPHESEDMKCPACVQEPLAGGVA